MNLSQHNKVKVKGLLTRNNHIPKPECPVRYSNQGVLVNLTYKLTRKQQTVKYESVSAGFPNNSHTSYRHGAADTENDNKLDKINVY